MGVPAFYRWLSEKYPKIVEDVLEERVHASSGGTSNIALPFDSTRPNPSGLECDNLYIDMNGIIHPCSHPEHGPQPTTEEEMYENVCLYVDRLFRAMRPRKLLYLAIDGVAPRAKMNQQRSRRFRSAQEARELQELEEHVRVELSESGQAAPPSKAAWDSNVITPGTPFMLNLAEYVRFYVRKRISTDKAWKDLRVIFSDASIPGEGEHKIMEHVRRQRSQPGYDPNTVHVLHGLDADLIMLALATHEAHFYISREEVVFGRKSMEAQERRQLESGFADQQRAFDEAVGSMAMELDVNKGKPFQRISIPTLREYLTNEFAQCLDPQRLPFAPSLERLIDDIVFLCFFVGNDFLPHLPSLDIRVGALDYLFNVYKRILPSMGDYITRSGGNVNLTLVDIILAEVGSIEDYVFAMKHENEQREQQRRKEMLQRRNKNNNSSNRSDAPPLPQHVVPPDRKRLGRSAKILEEAKAAGGDGTGGVVALSRGHQAKEDDRHAKKAKHMMEVENLRAAQALKESLLGGGGGGGGPDNSDNNDTSGNIQKDGEQPEKTAEDGGPKPDDADSTEEKEGTIAAKEVDSTNNDDETAVADATMKEADKTEQQAGEAGGDGGDASGVGDNDDDGDDGANAKRKRDENNNDTSPPVQQDSQAPGGDEKEEPVSAEKAARDEGGVGVVGDAEDEFEDDADDDDVVKEIDPEAAHAFKVRVKTEQQKKLDDYAKNVEDNVRLHESGWKDRYYTDKCKADDVSANGGREHLFRSYVVGLCWVMKYYYDGCPSWKWYYPFHYGPFASDLKNIERFEKDCKSMELATPFNPVEQLMAVLPSDSVHAIPKAPRWLMLDKESPIIDFYPKDVPVDPNGKAMPWLWVVLLPFIDEERLLAAMSPTIPKWTKEELFCNARGLDDGYLYVNRAHPLSKKLATVLEPGKTAKAPKTRLTDAGAYGCAGFSGSVRPPLSNEIHPVDEDVTIPPPATADRIDFSKYDSIFADAIEPNNALCVAFSEPPKLSHKSVLLPGAKLQRPKLTAADKQIRRPRLNRGGGSIANMGVSNGQSHQSGYGSMNIGSYERQLAEQTGRGNQLYQAGTRSWGSMEPTPKRGRPGPPPPPPPQVQNPFMGQPQRQVAQQQYGGQPQWQQNRGQWSGHPSQQAPPQYQQHQQYQQQQHQAYGGQYQQQPPPQQQYQQQQQQHQHRGQAQPPQYPGHQQQQQQQWRGGGYQQQQQPPRGQQGGHQPPNYGNRPQQPPPQQQQQGYDFRSFNQPPANRGADPRGQRPQGSQSNAQRGGRASADVMSNLKAQLASTLKQNKRQG